jgi:putative ABC transport system substrate-binding protein
VTVRKRSDAGRWATVWGAALAVTLILLAAPLAVEGQAARVSRIGVLANTRAESPRWAPFRGALREFGYVEGQNITVEWRASDGRAERLPDLAAELVRLKVDVIVADGNAAIAAAHRATKTIPIVTVLAEDPVASGFAATLARPGGNITGLTTQATDLQGKRLQLLKEAVPTASRVTVLWDPTEPGRQVQAREAEVAARALGLQAQLVEARGPADLDSIFAAMARQKPDAVLVHPSQMIFTHRVRIAELAARSRLPTIGPRWFCEAGGLLSYSASDRDLFQRAAHYVDKLLKGAKPEALPIEQPTKFDLVINMKAAKRLSLTIPPSLLLQADLVVE